MNTVVPNEHNNPISGRELLEDILQPAAEVVKVLNLEILTDKLETDDWSDSDWYPWEIF